MKTKHQEKAGQLKFGPQGQQPQNGLPSRSLGQLVKRKRERGANMKTKELIAVIPGGSVPTREFLSSALDYDPSGMRKNWEREDIRTSIGG